MASWVIAEASGDHVNGKDGRGREGAGLVTIRQAAETGTLRVDHLWTE
jgi:hypothetical protein